MALGEERLCSILESILLTAPDPVPVARLVEVVQIEDAQTEESAVRAAVGVLTQRYADPKRPIARGFRVVEVAGGLQVRTSPENASFVRRFLAAKPQRLSKAALETLAIIAYRQPVTKPEVEAVRGVDVGAALKNLLDRGMIRILGKRDEVGRPLIYGTSPDFLEFFGLKGLGELPSLREYHELDEEHQREVDALAEKTSVAELVEVASELVESKHDPDLDALDAAVKTADQVQKEAQAALDGPPEAQRPLPEVEPGAAVEPETAAEAEASPGGQAGGEAPVDKMAEEETPVEESAEDEAAAADEELVEDEARAGEETPGEESAEEEAVAGQEAASEESVEAAPPAEGALPSELPAEDAAAPAAPVDEEAAFESEAEEEAAPDGSVEAAGAPAPEPSEEEAAPPRLADADAPQPPAEMAPGEGEGAAPPKEGP